MNYDKKLITFSIFMSLLFFILIFVTFLFIAIRFRLYRIIFMYYYERDLSIISNLSNCN